jgi:hypothetical protein
MKTPYTYTVLRYVHDASTGEFINVGVALLAPEERYASAICRTTYGRLTKTFPGMDGEVFKKLMRHIQSRLDELGERIGGELPLDALPKTVLDLAHQVLPADDSSLQWSPPGSGLTPNPSLTLEALFDRMVATYDTRPMQENRSDDDVWRKYRRALEPRRIIRHLQPKQIAVEDDQIEFRYACKNGVWHCLEPISFDLTVAESIQDKAHRWLGQITSVKDSAEQFKLYLLLGEPQHEELRPAFERAVSILGKLPVDKQIVRENQAESFSEKFAQEMQPHFDKYA